MRCDAQTAAGSHCRMCVAGLWQATSAGASLAVQGSGCMCSSGEHRRGRARTRAVLLSYVAKPDLSLTVTVQFLALWHSSKTSTPSKAGPPHQSTTCCSRELAPARPPGLFRPLPCQARPATCRHPRVTLQPCQQCEKVQHSDCTNRSDVFVMYTCHALPGHISGGGRHALGLS
jgi:hypothetical protein